MTMSKSAKYFRNQNDILRKQVKFLVNENAILCSKVKKQYFLICELNKKYFGSDN